MNEHHEVDSNTSIGCGKLMPIHQSVNEVGLSLQK